MSDECERERIRGLPGPLPTGERILWRGAPRWQPLAWRAFHMREALAWFAFVGAVRTVVEVVGDGTLSRALLHNATLAPLALAACALLAGLAWASARTTIYTVTDRRVVMRVGIALPVTLNIPYARIAGAFARLDASGAGDVGLTIGDGTRLAWFVLWPHCRPWRVRAPEPMLRAVPDGARLANILSDALGNAARTDGGACVRTEVTAGAPVVIATPDGLSTGLGAAT